MNNVILYDVKQMLGLAKDYTPFDNEIVMHINATLMVLNQLGVGQDGFCITLSSPSDGEPATSTETWSQFLGEEYEGNMQAIKSYVFTKVKILFDPPASGTLMESYKKLADEFEFRLSVASGV